MYTATFYSYKGGVGRTLALMNTAARLSKKGKSVFILDFDLEAPGIDVFSASTRNSAGLLEYISEYCNTRRVPPLQSFVSEIHSQSSGRILYMPAGRRDAGYQRLLAQLNWKDFYSSESRGYLFVENLKAAIRKIYSPDYVLVDSRTGMTDISGICTLQLPDLVVLVFGLNEQNLLGTSQIFNSVTHNVLNRQIQTLLVASPVPDVPEYLGVRKERLERAKQLLGGEPDVVLPYNPFVALRESINPSELGEYLNEAYDKLCNEIIAKNRSDLTTVLNDVRRTRDTGDLELVTSQYQQILKAHPHSSAAWLEYGAFLRSVGRLDEALDAFKLAEQFGATPRTWRELAATNLFIGNFHDAREAVRKYLAASTKPSNALQLAELFANRDQDGVALEAYEYITKNRELTPELEANAWFDMGSIYLRNNEASVAVGYFEKALSREPSVLAINFNLATALARCGRAADATKYYEKAVAMFEQQPSKGLPGTQANMFQAMSQAYGFLGKKDKAVSLMQQAISIADSIPSIIYSSFQYRNVSSKEFRRESEQFLKQFQEGAEAPNGI
jgi:tetratricopeptide (TPR) repeat protein